MSTQPKAYITPEQYLEIERNAEFRSEYYRGEMFAMAGAPFGHNLIASNTEKALQKALDGRDCYVLHSDQRVLVNPTGLYTYPDLAVFCEEPRFLDGDTGTMTNPSLLVEVLSPSTEAYDRGRKFAHYRTIPSLRYYLMISSDEVSVDLFTRKPDGEWALTSAKTLDGSIEIAALNVKLDLADLYHRVKFVGPQRLRP